MAVYIVMGVSGVGKSTVGKLLALQMDLLFYDADDFHPPENVEKMKAGIPLQDEDRKGWLDILARKISTWNQKGGAVLACSALKEKYRKQLQSIPREQLTWIYLHSTFELIKERLLLRKDHFFKPELLTSQFETLEPPGYGIHIDANNSPEQIIQQIMQKLNNKISRIGLYGLGVMGKSLALNLASKGVQVSVFNRHLKAVEENVAKDFAASHSNDFKFNWFDEPEKFVASLARPRNIILMVNAGKTVDVVIENLLPHLEKDDLIIDGGNSHYKDSERREKFLKKKGILFLGTGISGGEEGALKGPSIMPGGEPTAYDRIGDILEKIAAKDKNGKACCTYIGPGGAGHFVKMLHNGIEYAEMQFIAEIYHFMRFSLSLDQEGVAGFFEKWNKEMRSYLLEISIEILRKKENAEFILDKILDAAKQKGTGGWSTKAALELGVPLDTITSAVMARIISGKKEQRVKAAEIYNTKPHKKEFKKIEKSLFQAFQAEQIINHAIGFDLLKSASEEYRWNLNLSEISRIWTNGCIIRSGLMEDLVKLFRENKDENLLLHKEIVDFIKEARQDLILVITQALQAGVPMPGMSAALNYLLSFTAAQTSANMIQAQRDYFGAHTYERVGKPRGEFFHTKW
ncbi:decarboxylating NADP(+)-dependent phosphogluconate dehydrogenase [Salegentibacter sediminis]|uniref:decarboxylating NADP(+)-dependent phosphogluconate dehydrogenase n=1 Tax=Salegentibacter sediminis TaxID=1930251 RepID=UPI0009BE7AA3|nr:decarboxylating NADP(+)-dependent phosphogluconate dehydrogenase [Salegentibacter sediminis]